MKTPIPDLTRIAGRQLRLLCSKSLLLICLGGPALNPSAQSQTLAGTATVTMEGDIASNLVTGADQFLLRKIDEATAGGGRFWHRDFSSWQAYEQSLATNRQHLAHILGASDKRTDPIEVELLATVTHPALRGRVKGYEVLGVRWPAFGEVHGEGLLFRPVQGAPIARVVAIPDADQTPEQLAGLAAGVP